MNLVDHYVRDNSEKIWSDCCAVDLSEASDNTLKEIASLCDFIADRSVHNIATLHSRLIDIGYKFADPDRAFRPAGSKQQQRLSDFESQHGCIPLFLRSIYSRLESVDFSQAYNQLSADCTHPTRGLGWHAKLIINSLDRVEEEWEQLTRDEAYSLSPDRNFFLWLGGTDSNEDPIGYELPTSHVDERISFEDEQQDLRGLLMTCFAWGGFPVYRNYPDGRHPAGVLYGVPNLREVLPILRQGLIEI